MKKLKAYLNNQEIWEHNGQKYSVIDQWKAPENLPPGIRYEELMRRTIDESQRFEVANITEGVLVKGRYKTHEEAIERIKSGKADEDRSFWSTED